MTTAEERVRNAISATAAQIEDDNIPPLDLAWTAASSPAPRRRDPMRRLAPVAAAASVLAIAVATAVVAALPGGRPQPGGGLPVTATAPPHGGPSARQLASGRWVKAPAAPIRLCDPVSAWDGRLLLVIEPGRQHCHIGMAAYDPRANTWHVETAPPSFGGPAVVAAWGGGRIIVVSQISGATFAWRPVSGRWHRIARMPSASIQSLIWTGQSFLAVTAHPHGGKAFVLTGRHWSSLPDLPRPKDGRIADAQAVTYQGGIYVLATVDIQHATSSSTWMTESVELLRWTGAGWRSTLHFSRGPQLGGTTAAVDGGIVTAGLNCGVCMETTARTAVLRPGTSEPVTVLNPPMGNASPADVAAGADAVVMTYRQGVLELSGSYYPHPPGSCDIYDLTDHRWLRGPTAPSSANDQGVVWTPYGVVSLGLSGRGSGPGPAGAGSWLLRPAR